MGEFLDSSLFFKCDFFRPLAGHTSTPNRSTSLQNLSSNGVFENNVASNLSTISSGSVLSLASNGSGGSSARKKKVAAPLPPVLLKSKVSASSTQEAAIPVWSGNIQVEFFIEVQ